MTEHTDVVILGMGTCGEDLGLRLAAAGLDVVGVEAALLGGECAYWACIPSKMMIRAANLLAEAERVNGVAGVADVRSEWSPVAQRIRAEASGDWDDAIAVERFTRRGGRFVRGRGTLDGPKCVVVDGRRIEASIGAVIATGSQPTSPPVRGLADVGYWTTHDAIRVEELPRSLVVLSRINCSSPPAAAWTSADSGSTPSVLTTPLRSSRWTTAFGLPRASGQWATSPARACSRTSRSIRPRSSGQTSLARTPRRGLRGNAARCVY